MKKFLVMFLASVLLCLLASVSWGLLTVRFNVFEDNCYVGYDGEFIASMLIEPAMGDGNFTIIGSLPPGCELKHNSGSVYANIGGIPTKSGTYKFTISATAVVKGINYRYNNNGFPMPYSTYTTDYGSTEATIVIRDSGNGTSNNGTSNNTGPGGGGGGGCNSGFTLLGLLAAAFLLRKSA